jgi:hypothetical protein
MRDYIEKLKDWAEANPTKATLIGAVVIAFAIGALVF